MIQFILGFFAVCVILALVMSLIAKPGKNQVKTWKAYTTKDGKTGIVYTGLVDKDKLELDKNLETAYKTALQGTDKAKALAAGRAYYRNLRGINYSVNDEAVIGNDIAAMRSE